MCYMFCILFHKSTILKVGILMRPFLEIIESAMLFLLWELFEDMVGGPNEIIDQVGRAGHTRAWFAIPPFCCLKSCLPKSTYTESIHRKSHNLTKQFCFVSPIISIVEAILIMLEKEGEIIFLDSGRSENYVDSSRCCWCFNN
eukprot:UN26297